MNVNKHILYISHIMPRQGTGGWIVMLRHLKRLEDSGWKISIAIPEQIIQNNQIPDSWKVIKIPSRRWWWLPVKDYLIGSLSLRILFWEIECKRALGKDRPNCILTILGDNYNLLAKSLSQSWNVPMSLIIHDDLRLRSQNQKDYDLVSKTSADIIKHSSRIWIVSQEMKESFNLDVGSQNVSVLRPIPEGKLKFVEWRDEFSKCPIIAHAGSLFDFHVDYFQKVAKALEAFNGKLLIIAKKSNPALITLQSLCNNIIHREEFERNEDVIDFLYFNANCMLVCYPYSGSQHKWTYTSFPSRLVEYMHLGLPYLVMADLSSSLGNWAKVNNWNAYIKEPDDNIFQFVSKLTQKHEWTEMASQSRTMAAEEFSATVIQSQFESELAILE